jgi:hypothetical protein
MIGVTPYLLLVLAHAIGDQILQTTAIATEKDTCKGALRHAGHLFLMSFLTTHVFGLANALKMATAVGLAHFGVDYGSSTLTSKKGPLAAIAGFIGEQTIHLLVLAWAAHLWGAQPDLRVLRFWGSMVPSLPTSFFGRLADIFLSQQTLVSLIVYIYVACAGSTLIRLTLESIGLTRPVASEAPQCGKYIGILERTLILTFMLNNALAAAAFVLTAKSIARYPQLSEGNHGEGLKFAEYYLIGTLLSALVAIMGGVFLRTLWLSLE